MAEWTILSLLTGLGTKNYTTLTILPVSTVRVFILQHPHGTHGMSVQDTTHSEHTNIAVVVHAEDVVVVDLLKADGTFINPVLLAAETHVFAISSEAQFGEAACKALLIVVILGVSA